MENPEQQLSTRTVTVTEAARILGISRAAAYQLARQQQLPGALKLGRRVVVSRAALDRVLEGEPAAGA